jgi:hypothetical protein
MSRQGAAVCVMCAVSLLAACGGDDASDESSGGAARAGSGAGGSASGGKSQTSGQGGGGTPSAGRGGSAGGGGGSPGGGDAGTASDGGDAGAAGGGNSAGVGGAAPTYGRFGEAVNTFTLPIPNATGGNLPALYHPDLGTEFPEVDFGTLDRLYLPAGEYQTVLLGGLPERTAQRPLVITNLGGQVKVGGRAANYVFSIRGGTNWVLTGRYDPESKTGDSSFRGHAEGRFAHSQGSYGIFIDDAFSKEGLSGLAIGGGASDFELDCLEVARAEFAGIVVKTDDDGEATMRNVKLHDLYVHDTGSEGLYLGSTQAQPQHVFEGLRIHDNRFLRTGTEALQVGQLGDDCEIHHNVLGPGATRWRSAFADYQDGNVQYGQRNGSSRFHHNLVIGTGDLFVEFFPTHVDSDVRTGSDTVTFSDNYFSDTSASGVYTHADENSVTVRFERNTFRGFFWTYPEVHPDATLPVQVFGIGSNTLNPHQLVNNRYDAPYPFVMWTFPSVSQENNTAENVAPVRFVDFMHDDIEANFRALEWWTATATRHPDMPAVTYAAGAYVVHHGTLYRALAENTALAPHEHPEAWEALPEPADDVRLAADSPHAELGIRFRE